MYEFIAPLINEFIGFEIVPLAQFISALFPLLFSSFAVSLIGRQKTLVWRCSCVAYVTIAVMSILASNGIYIPFKVI